VSMMSPSVTLSLSLVILVTWKVGAVSVQLEDVTAKQFRAALQTEDIRIAVFWYSKNCKTCDRVLSVLERVGEEVAGNGITLVRRVFLTCMRETSLWRRRCWTGSLR